MVNSHDIILEPASKPDKSKQKLLALLRITQAINNNFSSSDLFRIFEFVLRDQLLLKKFAYCSNDKPWKWMVSHGTSDELEMIQPDVDFTSFKDIGFIDENSPLALQGFEIIIPVYHKTKALAVILIGGLDIHGINEIRKENLEFIQTISNIIAVAIENKRLAKDNIHQELIKKELELASEMQALLFPEVLPKNDFIDLAAYYQPHRKVGGDYYDYQKISENEIQFCVADVSGKGMPAALLMSNFQANLRALSSIHENLASLVKALNEKVLLSAKGEKFITLFIARYNYTTRSLTYINAGHNPPALMSNGKLEFLKEGCTGLGMLDELPSVKSGLVSIHPKDLLFCFTDGLVEQENEEGKAFGADQLEKFLFSINGNATQDILNKAMFELNEFRNETPFFDDIALLACRFY